MTFAAFSAWAVAAMSVAAAFAVLALYLLRRTPRPQIVSNVDFWLRAMQQSRPKWLSSWRIPLLALLFSLLAAVGMVFLLGDPRFGTGLRGATIVVLDAGASMGAREESETRLDQARREIRRWAERATTNGEIGVVRAGLRPTVLAPLGDDPGELDRALDRIELDDGRADLPAAIALADAILAERGAAEGSQILVVADEQVRVASRAPVVTLPVGARVDTIAITRFSARRVPGAVGEYSARVAVRSFASRGATARVVVRDGETTILDERVELAPGEERALDAGGFSSARADLTANLASVEGVRDALEADDRAFASVAALRTTRVLLAANDRFLEAALAAHPGLDVTVVAPSALGSLAQGELDRFDAIVGVGASLPNGRSHRAQLLFAPPSTSVLRVGEALSAPRVTASLASHPALGGLRLDTTRVSRASALIERPGDQVLARSGDRTLALARDGGRARMVVLGFAPSDTDLVRGEGFPLLVHSTLEWVSARAQPAPLPERLGGMLASTEGAALLDADGQPVTSGAIAEVARAGHYRVGDATRTFDASEQAGALGAGATGGTFAAASTLPPLATIVAAALVLLLLIEWTLLHRGRLE